MGSECFNWDDFDRETLQSILGDFTDDDAIQEPSCDSCSESSGDDTAEPAHTKRGKVASDVPHAQQQTSCDRPKYVCPECAKELLTISGFRGHMLRKHNKPGLKGDLYLSEIRFYNFLSSTIT